MGFLRLCSVKICHTFPSIRMVFNCFYVFLASQSRLFEFDSFSIFAEKIQEKKITEMRKLET